MFTPCLNGSRPSFCLGKCWLRTEFATEALQILSTPRHSGAFSGLARLWDRFYSFLFGGAGAQKGGLQPLVLKIEKDLEVRVFQILRTEHQLGYVVFGFATAHMDILEVRILVQGFRSSPDVVASLIDDTVRNLTQNFQMKPEEFQVRKVWEETTQTETRKMTVKLFGPPVAAGARLA
eukprot:Skav214421  [mRNA]  locus=scaffold586:233033:236433:+ [translate_table: standard]